MKCFVVALSASSASVVTRPKCCRSFYKIIFLFRGGNADDDGRDGHDNGLDIHLKCVLACCSGTVADNDIADRTNREECAVQSEKTNERKLIIKYNITPCSALRNRMSLVIQI
ncbi:hypothetical protein OS493_035330 [Desmophyllum pertusum]|uniref:Uncharacterized protein n=1 Tax=Desmophyllum pertusum TaxID=174260 RepID=A0A9X0CCS2_9CNID|nr:hypothetical protein OS493_035330 [Desmophyllum pertusum]